MQELRCLFALMVGSTRRFVDPSAAVELLRDAFRTSEAQQVHHFFVLCQKNSECKVHLKYRGHPSVQKADLLKSQRH